VGATDQRGASLEQLSVIDEIVQRFNAAPAREVLDGGGECGELLRSRDWSKNPLGPVAGWPQSLRTSVGTMLASPFPMLLMWGPALVLLYNDAARSIYGIKHPAILGLPVREALSEVWSQLGPRVGGVLETGEAFFIENGSVLLARQAGGQLEEAWFTWSYIPARGETGGIVGLVILGSETTRQVVGERRLKTLRELSSENAVAPSLPAFYENVQRIFLENPHDLPFALVYALEGKMGKLVACAGVERGSPAAPLELLDTPDAAWPLKQTLKTGEGSLLESIGARFGALPVGAKYPPTRALVLPLSLGADPEPTAILIAGLNPLRPLDAEQLSFLQLLSHQLAAEIGRTRDTVKHRDREAELAHAREEAEAANRAKDEFLAILGHELRNPLAPITTALDLMKLRSAGVAEHERRVIERQVAHLQRLVDDLLDVSRISQGKIELRRARVEISQVIKEAVETASPLLETRHHFLDLRVPETGLQVDIDVSRIRQVISNLITNAAKYTEPGGHIVIEATHLEGRVVVQIRDNGVGISASMLPRVFEMFSQSAQSIDRSQGGLGLGLSIVKSLVELHGGTVTAESRGADQGSTFTFDLPALAKAPDEVIPDELSVIAPVGKGRRQRVLIVDDNEDAAELLSEILTSLGHLTRLAHDGVQALKIAPDFRPDIALLDIGLPVMDGFELARRIRADPQLSGMRLVAITGYGQPEDRRRSKAAGFDEHLVKPVQFEALEAALGRAAAST
jgi:signal transduction histidine kinase